jgi:POT family proton-dependent oligopeptide transporter
MGPRDETNGASAAVSTRHPIAFFFFFWGEFAERASYYGMRAILFLYLTTSITAAHPGLGFSDTEAAPIYSAFKMACYFLPLLGGFLADRYFGKYWTIVGFSVPYVIGHFVLGIPTHLALFGALALLAGGSGVIKPNISTLMGMTYDQQRPGQVLLRTAAFQWFYFAINVGAVISQLALPALRDNWGYAKAFQFPAWLMVASLMIFAAGKKTYAVETFDHPPLSDEERRQRWETLKTLFGFFVLMVLFWIPYEHNDTLWVAFSRDYVDRNIPHLYDLSTRILGDHNFLSPELSPDQLQFVNPLFVLILIPVFNALFKWIDPKMRVFTPFLKILLGFFLTAAAAGILALAAVQAREFREKFEPILDREREALKPLMEIEERQAQANKEKSFLFGLWGGLSDEERAEFEKEKQPYKEMAETFKKEKAATSALYSNLKISIWWMVIAYIVLTVGEVLLYGTGLELAYTMAPKNMKGFITACFLVTNALGNLVNLKFTTTYGGSLADPAHTLGSLAPGKFFGVSASIALVAAIVFFFIGGKLGRPRVEPSSAHVPD